MQTLQSSSPRFWLNEAWRIWSKLLLLWAGVYSTFPLVDPSNGIILSSWTLKICNCSSNSQVIFLLISVRISEAWRVGKLWWSHSFLSMEKFEVHTKEWRLYNDTCLAAEALLVGWIILCKWPPVSSMPVGFPPLQIIQFT